MLFVPFAVLTHITVTLQLLLNMYTNNSFYTGNRKRRVHRRLVALLRELRAGSQRQVMPLWIQFNAVWILVGWLSGTIPGLSFVIIDVLSLSYCQPVALFVLVLMPKEDCVRILHLF